METLNEYCKKFQRNSYDNKPFTIADVEAGDYVDFGKHGRFRVLDISDRHNFSVKDSENNIFNLDKAYTEKIIQKGNK